MQLKKSDADIFLYAPSIIQIKLLIVWLFKYYRNRIQLLYYSDHKSQAIRMAEQWFYARLLKINGKVGKRIDANVVGAFLN